MERSPCYFIRANGSTSHNDPGRPECYVPGEPPQLPETRFNYAQHCLAHAIARIGWPAAGDLRRGIPTSTPCYPISTRVRQYLAKFRDIGPGSIVLMPDPDADEAGALYVGTVTHGYAYDFSPPERPFECAHHIGVEWDWSNGAYRQYSAADLGIGTRGGFWAWAFHLLEEEKYAHVIGRIETARRRS